MADFDFGGLIGGLVKGGFDLWGNDQKYKQQQSINAQNLQNAIYMDTHHIQNVVNDAKAAGINPLAALGSTTPSAPVAVGAGGMGEGIQSAGQDIGAAIGSFMKQDDKDEAMKRRLLQLQIDSAEADVTAKQLANSKNATTFASPGRPPGLPAAQPIGTPLPRARPGRGILEYDPPQPLYTSYIDDHGDRVRLLSKEASQSLMNSASMPISVPIGAQMLGGNVVDLTAQHVRPDVIREWMRGTFGGVDRGPVHRRTGRYTGGFWDR